ncbi:hypothetical protein ACFQX7_21310 [Luedemannella flava]
MRSPRVWCAVVGLLAALLPATPAAAAPTCERTTAFRAIADVPWPQQRWDYATIGALADGSGVTVAVLDSEWTARTRSCVTG